MADASFRPFFINAAAELSALYPKTSAVIEWTGLLLSGAVAPDPARAAALARGAISELSRLQYFRQFLQVLALSGDPDSSLAKKAAMHDCALLPKTKFMLLKVGGSSN